MSDVVALEGASVEFIHAVSGQGAGVDSDERVLMLGDNGRVKKAEGGGVVSSHDLMAQAVVGLLERRIHDMADHIDVADMDVTPRLPPGGDRPAVGDGDAEPLVRAHEHIGRRLRVIRSGQDPPSGNTRHPLVVGDRELLLGAQGDQLRGARGGRRC